MALEKPPSCRDFLIEPSLMASPGGVRKSILGRQSRHNQGHRAQPRKSAMPWFFNFANDYVMARLSRIKGLNMPWILGNRISAMRLRLDPERMRAHNLSSDDVMKALQGCRMMGSPQRLGQSDLEIILAAHGIAANESRLSMRIEYRRRFNMADGLIVTVATAATLALLRDSPPWPFHVFIGD
jgi:hypothetical protein